MLVHVYIKLVCKIHPLVEDEAFILKPVQGHFCFDNSGFESKNKVQQ